MVQLLILIITRIKSTSKCMSPTGQNMLGCSHQRKLNYLLYDDTKGLREALRYEHAYVFLRKHR